MDFTAALSYYCARTNHESAECQTVLDLDNDGALGNGDNYSIDLECPGADSSPIRQDLTFELLRRKRGNSVSKSCYAMDEDRGADIPPTKLGGLAV